MNTMTGDAFQQAGNALSTAKNRVREELQEKTSTEMKLIISKLQSSDAMAPQDIDLIKIWIVGDAMGYEKMENNFQDWIAEYKRLETALAQYEIKECSPEELMEFHGILEDATRLSYDLSNYLEKHDRVKKFQAAVAHGIDDKGRNLLLNMLSAKLNSPEV
jgi:hypothetical protein